MNKIEHIEGNLNLFHKSILLIAFVLLSSIKSQGLAVLDIAPLDISDEKILTLSEQFREVISTKIGREIMSAESVQKILEDDQVNNRWCAEEWCGKEIGGLLKAEETIVSSIWKDDKIYRIKGLLINIESDSVTISHEFDFAGEEESLFNEVEYMAHVLLSTSQPPEIQRQHEYIDEKSLALQGITEKRMRLKATLLSTVVPGLGQYYLKNKLTGGAWLSTQLILGSFALSEYLTWRDSYDDYYRYEDLYLTSTDVNDIENYRNEMIKTYDLAKSSIKDRKKITNIISSLWILNILHAYLISPSTDEILNDISIRFSHHHITNEFQLRLILAIN